MGIAGFLALYYNVSVRSIQSITNYGSIPVSLRASGLFKSGHSFEGVEK
jgi:hypothetical protein